MSSRNSKNTGRKVPPQKKDPKRESPKQAALRHILDAWDEAVFEGIDPEMLSNAAIYAAMCEMVASQGEDATAAAIAKLVKRIKQGEFTIYRTLQ